MQEHQQKLKEEPELIKQNELKKQQEQLRKIETEVKSKEAEKTKLAKEYVNSVNAIEIAESAYIKEVKMYNTKIGANQ